MVRFENAVRSFVSNMKDRPTFGLFWFNGVSHDYLNLPRIGDTLFRGMLDKLKEEGALKSTVLIGLSDHGIRWGDFRQTFQGFLEERLPLATIVLPESFMAKYPEDVESLTLNSRRLSTPFDIYKTLLDILYKKYQSIPNNYTDEPNRIHFNPHFKERGHGISLFSKIPVNRTCTTAGIPPEWCACSTLQVVPTNITFAKRLARIAVKSINRRLRNATQCELLTLETVNAVWEDIPATLDVQSQYLFSDYVVNFETSPGRGRFEARLRVRGSIDERMKPKSIIRLIGFISRLNMYKKDSYCVGAPLLKLYCYCSPGSKRTTEITEGPSEFLDEVHQHQLSSSLTKPKWPITKNNIESSFSLADLAKVPEDTSKRRKLKKFLTYRTRYEIVKMRRRNRTDENFGSTSPLYEGSESRRQHKIAQKQAREQASTSTIISSTSTLSTRHKQELIDTTNGINEASMLDTEKLDVPAPESNVTPFIGPAYGGEDEKFPLEGLDTNYRS
uniref:Uncharacterized protein n=1 Tax=Lygus hesperus TaxID=30085 RepID=A0A0K8TC27_LYGHE